MSQAKCLFFASVLDQKMSDVDVPPREEEEEEEECVATKENDDGKQGNVQNVLGSFVCYRFIFYFSIPAL